MGKTYWLRFGSTDPAGFTGLTPTLSIFSYEGVSSIAAPGITELPAGSGLYQFQYTPHATASIIFKADGGAALSNTDRYLVGALDPLSIIDQRLGTTLDSYGSTSVDPATILGFLKRTQEFLEGDASFNKSTAVWSIYDRGSSTLLREKDLTNTTTSATKTGV